MKDEGEGRPVTVVLKLSWQIRQETSPIRFFMSLSPEMKCQKIKDPD